MKFHPFATIQELQKKLDNKEITLDELLDYYLTRFEALDKKLGSSLEVFDKKSILEGVNTSGPLRGIPGLIKDNICQKDRITSCASKILKDFRPPYDATVITRLKEKGATFIGRANMDEFAMGSSNETSAYHITRNPWDLSRVPGGSSGGSAAAVAAGLIPWSLGSETGGSVRQPAALCGIVGLKPTYGRVSRYGLIAYASSLDQIGVMTRTVYDNALVFSHIAGKDERDSSSLDIEALDYTKHLDGKLPANLKIGIVDNTLTAEGMDPEVVDAIKVAIEKFKSLGATIHNVSLPSIEYSAAAYFILSRAEAASNLARFDGVRYGFRNKQASTLNAMYADTRHDGFGKEVKKRIMVGNYVLSSSKLGEFYDNAKKVQRLIRADFAKAFQEVDLLIMPTSPMAAFKIGEFAVDPLKMDLQDYFTCPMNIAGIPAISIPCGFTQDKLPIGFQLAGPHCAEERIFKAAHAYEQATPWHTMHPEL